MPTLGAAKHFIHHKDRIMSIAHHHPPLSDQQRFDADVKRYGALFLKTLAGAGVFLALLISIAALLKSGDTPAPAAQPASGPAKNEPAAAAPAAAPTLAEAKGIEFEPFERVDPALPAVPAGDVKKFEVDVYHHVTQVSKDLAPTEVWSYKVNGVEHRGTGFSEPMVVEVGDTVDFSLTNGSSERMQVTLPHSLDFHSAEVNPGKRYADLAPGERMHYRFVAEHPGVFMYHCATQPVLMHTGMGMVGAMVVKPKGLAPARDLFLTQQEYYIGEPGKQADMTKMAAKRPTSSPSTATRTSTRTPRSRSSAASGSACGCSTPGRASGAPST
jgi:nitrite reductase (NO-forming)